MTESARLNLICPLFKCKRRARSQNKSEKHRQNGMGRNNNAPKAIDAVTIVESVEPQVKEAPLLTIVQPEVEEPPRKLSLDEKIQKVEDLSVLIDRFRGLVEAKRKLTVFQLGADGMSSSILLKDASGNEFKTSNSAVISAVIDEMKKILDLKVRDIEDQINF